jgi:hypothetical protein
MSFTKCPCNKIKNPFRIAKKRGQLKVHVYHVVLHRYFRILLIVDPNIQKLTIHLIFGINRCI